MSTYQEYINSAGVPTNSGGYAWWIPSLNDFTTDPKVYASTPNDRYGGLTPDQYLSQQFGITAPTATTAVPDPLPGNMFKDSVGGLSVLALPFLAAGGAAALGGEAAAGGALAGEGGSLLTAAADTGITSDVTAGLLGGSEPLMPAAVAPSAAGYELAPFASASGAPATVGTLADIEAAASGLGLPAISAGLNLPSIPSIPQPVKDAATVAGAAGTVASLGAGSQSDQYLNPANDPMATPEGQAASTAANSEAGSGMNPDGSPSAGYPGYDLSSMNPGFLKSLADSLGMTPAELAKLGGALIPAALGAYGSYQQSNTLKDLADRFASYGAPYRTKLSELYADPSKFASSPEVQVPVQQGTDALARSLSSKVGNPIGNPGAMSEIQDYATNQLYGRIGQEKDRLAGFGGLTAYNAAAPGAATAAAGSERGILDAIGYGVGNYLNPPSTLDSLLKQLQGSNIFKVA